MTDNPPISIPKDLLPTDGRFCSGPSKIRPEALAALADSKENILGTSHRQFPIQFLVGELRNGLAELFDLPDGYEIILGNGGTTAFWDAASFCLVENAVQHDVFGEFSAKFAKVTAAAPHVEVSNTVSFEYGSAPGPTTSDVVDTFALTHNETSTGVMADIVRPVTNSDALVLVDATSAAGGLGFNASECDAYYLAPQKGLASDGGLWLAAMSPAAMDRIEKLSSERWVPAFLDLQIAVTNSRKDQTYNTPAIATLFLANQQVQWILQNGGLSWASARCSESAKYLYDWAEASDYATPYVTNENARSHVVGTIDLDEEIDAKAVSDTLRQNGVVDTESYRKLGRNQLRVAMYPAIDPGDVNRLTKCVDFVVENLVSANA